ncbi:MAG: hypothetical protein GY913_03845 [Proteobacteria bacterium]|nr:hypothetical protein [Pseudomonadota bacterium]MCP4916035.1 hypothetical protein [Pseudomonadota bacterium]
MLLLLACGPRLDVAPAADDWSTEGPGGPAVSFSEAELGEPCAYLLGQEGEAEHHNLVVMHDGYLFMPWAPEDGGGGISWFDVSDPCAPVKVGEGFHEAMRETHTLAFGEVDGREYLIVDSIWDEGARGGIGVFDITDKTSPEWVGELDLPGFFYPEAYFWVSLSTFWQGDVLYVSTGLLGVFLVDMSDPTNPTLLSDEAVKVPTQVTGSFHVIGNLALASSAGSSATSTFDVSDPLDPSPLHTWDIRDSTGDAVAYYFANVGGAYALFARKAQGGGPIVYDLREPLEPPFVGDALNLEADGGYVFRHEDVLFQGESEFASIYSFDDPSNILELFRFELQGDLDTPTPIGNIAVLSVDSGAAPGEATAMVPWATEPDGRGPVLELTSPSDGDIHVATTGRIGLSFDELLEVRSGHLGSVRVWDEDGVLIPGRVQVQESLVNFTPDDELVSDTSYFVEVPAGGIADSSLNAMAETVRFAFSTGAEVVEWPSD